MIYFDKYNIVYIKININCFKNDFVYGRIYFLLSGYYS